MQNFKRALITGASSGIGLALAKLMASKGIPLVLTGRDEKKLLELARKLDVDVQTIAADLSRPEERQLVIAAIHQLKPDLVVNNAGQGLYGEAVFQDLTKQKQLLEVNVNALHELTIEAVSTMKKEGMHGVVMNISSAAAFQVFPYFALYSATKSFVNQFSESLNAELNKDGIYVLTSCPGMVTTNFRVRSGGKVDNSKKRQFMAADFAAAEIWKQIQSKQSVRVFDWRYRFLTFLSKWIVPKRLLLYMMKNSIRSVVEK